MINKIESNQPKVVLLRYFANHYHNGKVTLNLMMILPFHFYYIIIYVETYVAYILLFTYRFAASM